MWRLKFLQRGCATSHARVNIANGRFRSPNQCCCLLPGMWMGCFRVELLASYHGSSLELASWCLLLFRGCHNSLTLAFLDVSSVMNLQCSHGVFFVVVCFFQLVSRTKCRLWIEVLSTANYHESRIAHTFDTGDFADADRPSSIFISFPGRQARGTWSRRRRC